MGTTPRRTPPAGLRAVRTDLDGQSVIVFSHPVAADACADGVPWPSLSAAERAVTKRLLDGWSYARIAATRGVAKATVAKQAETIYRKLGVHSRSELVARYPGFPRGR